MHYSSDSARRSMMPEKRSMTDPGDHSEKNAPISVQGALVTL